jgi:hypothetical protein
MHKLVTHPGLLKALAQVLAKGPQLLVHQARLIELQQRTHSSAHVLRLPSDIACTAVAAFLTCTQHDGNILYAVKQRGPGKATDDRNR